MSTKAAPRNGSTLSEVDLLAASPAPTVTIDDETFSIGKMGAGASLRFTKLLASIMARVMGGLNVVKPTTDEERQQAITQFVIRSLFEADDYIQLVSIVLSSSHRDVPTAWVEAHWDFGLMLEAVNLWLDANPLDEYVGKGMALATKIGTMFGKTPTRTG